MSPASGMRKPDCPNCREPMSSVEHGLNGVWSCLYCEGCWLSKAELSRSGAAGADVAPPVAVPAGQDNPDLVCPACATASFVSFKVDGAPMHRCRSCESIFLGKSALAQVAPHAVVRGWDGASTLRLIMGGAVGGDVAVLLAFWLFGQLLPWQGTPARHADPPPPWVPRHAGRERIAHPTPPHIPWTR